MKSFGKQSYLNLLFFHGLWQYFSLWTSSSEWRQASLVWFKHTLSPKRRKKKARLPFRAPALCSSSEAPNGVLQSETQEPQSSGNPSGELSLQSRALELQPSKHLNQVSAPPQTPGMWVAYISNVLLSKYVLSSQFTSNDLITGLRCSN